MSALEKTIAALAKSRNDAAAPVLLAALSSPDRAVFAGAVGALVDRRGKAGHQAVVALWHTLTAAEQAHLKRGRGRMIVALREAILGPDDQLFANGCAIAETIFEFELMPALVTLAEHQDANRSEQAVRIALRLVAELEHMTHASRDARDRQNTDIIRQGVLDCLERSLERFRQHRRTELVEAFVALAGAENKSLRAILDAPHHPCFATMVEVFTRSENPAVVGLLISLLTVADVPQVLRSIAGKRTDAEFLAALLAARFDWGNPVVLKAVGRIKQLACLESAHFDCQRHNPAQQASAVRLLSATSVPDEQKLELFDQVLTRGDVAGRREACRALPPLAGQRSNELAMRALADADPEIQISAIGQIRERHIPGSLAKLIELTEHPVPEVRQTALEALPEFSLGGFLEQFETLDDAQRRSTAAMVARIDRGSPQQLRQELDHPAPRRRLRAIEVIALMGVAPDVADALVHRLTDEDHMVRAAAADALHTCTSLDVRDALIAALSDRSAAVQKAAQHSLDALAGGRPTVARR